MRLLNFLMLSLIIFIGCKTSNTSENISLKPKSSNLKTVLIKKSTVDFSIPDNLVIDDLTPTYNDFLDSSLYFYDTYNQRLLVFSLKDNMMLGNFSLKESLNENATIAGMTFLSNDSILLYDIKNKQLHLIGIDSGLYKSIDLKKYYDSRPNTWSPIPFISNSSGLSIINGHLKISGYISGESKDEQYSQRHLLVDISLKNNYVKTSLPYPTVYNDKNYGGFYYRIPYSTINSFQNKFLISLPASHEIIEIDLLNDSVKCYNMSPNHTISIPAIQKNKMALRNNKTLAAKHYSINYSYKNIIYHPFKKLYVRILELPVDKKDLNKEMLSYKNCVALVYDSLYQYIGEYPLDKFISTDNFYLTTDGICFLYGGNKNEKITQYIYYKFE